MSHRSADICSYVATKSTHNITSPSNHLPNKRSLPTPKLALRPIQMRIQHRALPSLNRLHRLGQKPRQFLYCACVRGPTLAPTRRVRNPAIIRRRRERYIQRLVIHLRPLPIRMDEEHTFSRRVPALVVEYDDEDGDAVPLRDPVDASGYAEQECAVADDLTHEFSFVRAAGEAVGGELYA